MGVTTTGEAEFRAAVRALPARVRAMKRQVIAASARRWRAGVVARLQAQTRGTGATANAVTVTVRSDDRGFVGGVRPVPGRDPLVAVYLEYGTWKMEARPFVGPATDAESPTLARAADQAYDRVLREGLT